MCRPAMPAAGCIETSLDRRLCIVVCGPWPFSLAASRIPWTVGVEILREENTLSVSPISWHDRTQASRLLA